LHWLSDTLTDCRARRSRRSAPAFDLPGGSSGVTRASTSMLLARCGSGGDGVNSLGSNSPALGVVFGEALLKHEG
jgi:hypothetical protein